MAEDDDSTDSEAVTAIAAAISAVGNVFSSGVPVQPGEEWKCGMIPEKTVDVLHDILCMCRSALSRDLGVPLPD